MRFDSFQLTRQGGIALIIAAMHLVLLWALMSALNGHVVVLPSMPMVSTVLQPRRVPPPPPPPMPTVSLKLRTNASPPIIAPVITIPVPVEAPPAPVTPAHSVGSGTSDEPTVPPHVPVRVEPKNLYKPPDPDMFYPMASQAMQERGITLMMICLTSEAKIDSVEIMRSSGYKRLDAAALTVARQTRWSYATKDGKPVYGCTKFYVSFGIKEPQ